MTERTNAPLDAGMQLATQRNLIALKCGPETAYIVDEAIKALRSETAPRKGTAFDPIPHWYHGASGGVCGSCRQPPDHPNHHLPTPPSATRRRWLPWTPEETARRFHDAYEEFAPIFGYTTREDTRQFDPESQNGALMIAVVRNVLIEQAQNVPTDGSAKETK